MILRGAVFFRLSELFYTLYLLKSLFFNFILKIKPKKSMSKRICIIGLDRNLVEIIKKEHFGSIIHHETIPKYVVNNGILYVERSNSVGMLPVDKVIFHGIYEDDFDFITALTIWGGDCYPNAYAMMNCRLKLPCLARALRVSNFADKRGFVSPNTAVNVQELSVAKWGNWHCGENKAKFDDNWKSTEAAVIERFFDGESVRIVSIGNNHLQIKLEGDDWLKSIHNDKADFMPIDKALLEDTLKIKKAFEMDMIANDYIVGNDGHKYLLEVNHIPNVERFEVVRDIYMKEILAWIKSENKVSE